MATRVGITGHQRLQERDASAWSWVKDVIARRLRALPQPIVGLSALAAGADQVFAALVLEQGGTLDLWLPFKGYADLLSPDARASFWSLHDAAARVQWVEQRVEVEDPIVRDEAYLSASHHIVNECQHLFAVWDGRPARSVGSTAAIVAYAKNTAADRRRYSIRMLARFEESDFESVVGGGF